MKMKSPFYAVIIVLASVSMLRADPLPDEMVQKFTEMIRKHCPEATIDKDGDAFNAKHGTMIFSVHRRSKTGEVSPDLDRVEGPNFKGFMLRVSLGKGKYEGAAQVPQTLKEPYYSVFIDAPPTADRMNHYQVSFSYGSRLDPDLKKAIFEMIPKTRFAPATQPSNPTTQPSNP
jgi:hypothetical protein